MADFILIIPKIRFRKTVPVTPPFVFLQLSACLEKSNFTSELIDARIETDYLEKIRQKLKDSPLFIGITSMTGSQSVEGLKIAKFVKAIDKKIPVIWGGIHAYFFPEQILENDCVDVVVMGEGESTVVLLAKEYSQGNKPTSKIKGIAFKECGLIIKNLNDNFLDLNSLPFPAWHLIKDKIKYYSLADEDEKGLQIITSRGCPHACSFCYNQSYNKSRFRSRSVENILNEIDFLHKEYGIKNIRFGDDNFMTDRKRVVQICEGLQKNKNIKSLHCDIRADYIEDELLHYMVDQGFKKFYLGIESGSQKILNLINKNITVEKIKQGVSLLNKYTLGGHTYSFMIGFPDETAEDIKGTWELARWIFNIDKNAHILLNVYTPYPGTELMDILINRGFKMPDSLSDWGKYHWFSVEHKKWVNDPRLIKSLITIFRFAFYRSNNILIRFLSNRAKKVFLTGKFRSYIEFEFLYYLLKTF